LLEEFNPPIRVLAQTLAVTLAVGVLTGDTPFPFSKLSRGANLPLS
jgi:hypothetical protein